MSPVCSQPSARTAVSWRVPVAGHHARGADADLAVLAGRQRPAVFVLDGDLAAGHGQPDAAGAPRAEGVGRDERGRLGTSVSLVDQRARHPGLELPPDLVRQRGCSGHDGGQLGQAGLLQRLAEEHLDHRRHQRAALRPVLPGQLDPAGRVEPAHEDGPGALGPVQPAAQDQQAVDMREGQGQDRGDDVGPHRDLVHGPSAPEQVRVGQRDALGPAGGAAGEQQGGQVGP